MFSGQCLWQSGEPSGDEEGDDQRRQDMDPNGQGRGRGKFHYNIKLHG